MLFSHVKISSFRAKARLVFHWCLYNKHHLNDAPDVSEKEAQGEDSDKRTTQRRKRLTYREL